MILLGNPFGSSAQVTTYWANGIGGIYGDYGKSIAIDTMGNVFVVGDFNSNSINFGNGITLNGNGGTDIFLAKYNSFGEVEWVKVIGGTNDEKGNTVAVDSIGNIYISGLFGSPSVDFGNSVTATRSKLETLFITKFNNDGEAQWVKTANGSGEGKSLVLDKLHNIYLTGSIFGSLDFGNSIQVTKDGGNKGSFIVKYDKDGIAQWAKAAGGGNIEGGKSVAVDTLGNIYVTGEADSETLDFGNGVSISLRYTGPTDAYIVKFNSEGAAQWAKEINGVEYDEGNSIVVDLAGNVYATGYFISNELDFGNSVKISGTSWFDTYIVKYDTDGIAQWAKTPTDSSEDEGRAIAIDKLGNLFVVGSYGSGTLDFGNGVTIKNLEGEDIYISKFNTDGQAQWAKSYGGESYFTESGNSMSVDKYGNLYISGTFENNSLDFGNSSLITSKGQKDAFVLKLGLNDPDNVAPSIKNSMLDYKLNEGFEKLEINLLDYFQDSNNDPLYFKVTSSNQSLVTYDVSGQTLTILEKGIGTVDITVIADDGRGGKVSDSFTIIVLENKNPVVRNTIPSQVFYKGFEKAEFDLTNIFEDENEDSLSITATSKDVKIVDVNISDNHLSIIEKGIGKTMITITANDGNGGEISTTFYVTVKTKNKPEIQNSIEDQYLTEGFDSIKIDLSDVFLDDNDDTLSFSAVIENEGIAIVSISDSNLIIHEKGIGATKVIVTATDQNEGSVQDSFSISIEKMNLAPFVVDSIQNQSLSKGFGTEKIDFSLMFFDDDQDSLSISVSSNNEQVVKVSISETFLIIEEKGSGTAIVTITADDGRGGKVEQTFEIVVSAIAALINDKLQTSISFYPNPVKDFLTITSEQFIGKLVKFSFFDISGRKIHFPEQEVGIKNHKFDFSSIPEGVYTIIIEVDGKFGVQKVMK
ncbi:SBBP repeat-containing protein [Flexithrix dorotheae]|uniref:SBBP repeat-containing protein n=1 Tax=Flexithrix dorotheae TaxID=70993 RepID=UPI00146A74AD|nr:SBBP repeat-containing protein [Flexithrix dorotheae]